MIRHLTLIAAASLTAMTAPAFAGTMDDSTHTMVEVADLDLATANGRARLDTRVQATINRLCRADSRSLADQMRTDRCRATALASVAPQVEQAIALAQRGQRLAALDAPAVH